MSLINYASKEINCKIVYYGPGLGGKTTNIKYIYSKITPDQRGKLVALTRNLTGLFSLISYPLISAQ